MCFGQVLSLFHCVSQQIKAKRQKREKPARLPSYSHVLAPSFGLISSICFQEQLPQLCRPPTTSLSDILDSSKSSSVSASWHCQCPLAPCSIARGSYQAKTSPFSLARDMFTVNTLSNSSASLLSPRFVLIIVTPVCHHMANDSPRQKRRRESEEVSAWEKKRCVCLQKGQDWEINKNITHAAE